MDNFEKAFEVIWGFAPYYDVIYKNIYNFELIEKVLKVKNLKEFFTFLENEKQKLNKEFIQLYSKEVIQKFIKYWLVQDNFIDSDMDDLVIGVNAILKYMIQRKRITVEEYKKSNEVSIEKFLIPLTVSYTGENTIEDMYAELKKDSIIGNSGYLNYGLNMICRNTVYFYYLPISFLYVELLKEYIKNKSIDVFSRLNKIKNETLGKKLIEKQKIIGNNSTAFKNISNILVEIENDYLLRIKNKEKYLIYGELRKEDKIDLDIDVDLSVKYEDMVLEYLNQFEIESMGLIGESWIIN